MRLIENEATIKAPVQQIWKILSDIQQLPKYVDHVHGVSCEDEQIKLGTVWHDVATFVFPGRFKHVVTVFEEEKRLGFDVNLFPSGFIKERILFVADEERKATKIEIKTQIDLENRALSFLFEGIFERKFKKSMDKAVLKIKEELEDNRRSS